MRTETVTYQIFSLGELSPEARARAYRKWLNDEPEYGWNAENKQTLNAFCDLLGIRSVSYTHLTLPTNREV